MEPNPGIWVYSFHVRIPRRERFYLKAATLWLRIHLNPEQLRVCPAWPAQPLGLGFGMNWPVCRVDPCPGRAWCSALAENCGDLAQISSRSGLLWLMPGKIQQPMVGFNPGQKEEPINPCESKGCEVTSQGAQRVRGFGAGQVFWGYPETAGMV